MTGRYASKGEAKKKGNVINNCGWWFKPWFYQHAQKALKKGEFVEYIPTREYYHRHTRSLYWEGKLILPFGDQWWFRFLLGWMMPPKVSLLKATQGEAIRNYYHENHVIQDMLVPLYRVGDALEWVHREMEPQYAMSELNEKDFWRMFDGSLYDKARRKYKAVGTFMSVYYKCKKGRKTEKEVAEAEKEVAEAKIEVAVLETPEVKGT
ncbi:hypothetical protein Cgig2_032156 [Carnegiea gigantea]|uniref:Uncharacterized protein n=1 Tax=Carnegiea gigantea TaxID=171969 RepID=A0A9Q1GJC5_9CARY|nr:hypothetical protein Cgig2_032156 [Carnegiea gigantea]